ncbi:helix-turn-helix domain-containing protein [Anaerostipes sp.]|uniref:helix-turn-helix domain-containing protein n=1 Tax=Anaerostipes sp. TaxID=1872530 RepID=UPI0025C59974|nr:helix-turn-helix transcriptional regulator [Anaerostipes sp.]MBS7008473.1 helix-turn-helix transcriptional regulator [Anaerostipes sp.]
MGLNEIIKIGGRIKEFRKQKGFTQKQMAKAVGIPYSTYSNYENNNRVPKKEQLEKIVKILGITISDLVESSVIERELRILQLEYKDLKDNDDIPLNTRLESLKIYEEEIKNRKEALALNAYLIKNNKSSETINQISNRMAMNIQDLSFLEKRILESTGKLNDEGKKKVFEYANDLVDSSKYQQMSDQSHLVPIAAHNDNIDDPEQRELIEEDLKDL